MDPVHTRVIVVGCGNHLASDEAAGLEAADQLRRLPGHICEVQQIESCTPSFLAGLPPETFVVFVAAIRSGARPGTIHGIRLSSSELIAETAKPGSGQSTVARPEIKRLLQLPQPRPQMYLIGIEVEKWDPGFGITTRVHAAILEVVRELAKLNGKGQPKLPFFPDM